MKTSRLFIMVIGMFILSACGDDSSGSGGKYTGNKSDINSAKGLVHDYLDQNYFEKGFITHSKVRENLALAQTYLSYTPQADQLPDKYYAMRYVGCIAADGTVFSTEQNKHTQMDYVIGSISNRAVYVQRNSTDSCYIGQLNYGGFFGLGGIVGGSMNRTKGFGKLPTDVCQSYEVDQALVRIPKERLGYAYKSNNNNYWGYQNRWTPDKDFYYDIKNNRYGVFSNYNVAGNSEEDSFGEISNGEAVFVSKSLRARSSNPSCDKDVFWGFEVDPANPPQVQILGRN